jgi:DNA-binding transcriptional regulator YhcF (GntR family)
MDSVEYKLVDKYMQRQGIDYNSVQALAVEKMVNPVTGEQVYLVPKSDNFNFKTNNRVVFVTMNKHGQMCKVTEHSLNSDLIINKNLGQEKILFPSFGTGDLKIDANSGLKYELGSLEMKAILKFISKPENKMLADEAWLLANS